MDSKPAAAVQTTMAKESPAAMKTTTTTTTSTTSSQSSLSAIKQSIAAAEAQRKGISKIPVAAPEKQVMNNITNNYHHQYQAQPSTIVYVKKEERTVASLMGDNGDDDDEIGLDELDDDYLNAADSPSPPPMEFQRHNSMTRKQATSLAMQRAMQIQQKSPVVSLSQLPPPLENCLVESDLEVLANASPGVKQAVQAHYHVHSHIAHSQAVHAGGHVHGHYTNRQHNNPIQVQFHATGLGGGGVRGVPATSPSTENLVLAPPPQFSDESTGGQQQQQQQMGYHHVGHYHGGGGGANGQQNVRIVGAVPKSTNRF